MATSPPAPDGRKMQSSHRQSYTKTAITALIVAFLFFALAARWIALGRPGWPFPASAVLADSGSLAWALASAGGLIGAAGLLVAIGGFFALRGDANEHLEDAS